MSGEGKRVKKREKKQHERMMLEILKTLGKHSSLSLNRRLGDSVTWHRVAVSKGGP